MLKNKNNSLYLSYIVTIHLTRPCLLYFACNTYLARVTLTIFYHAESGPCHYTLIERKCVGN